MHRASISFASDSNNFAVPRGLHSSLYVGQYLRWGTLCTLTTCQNDYVIWLLSAVPPTS